jgi:acyl transferase domain-containing protein
MDSPKLTDDLTGSEIAVIGMACRFPGARNLDEFWQLLRDGVEAVRQLSPEQIEPSLVDLIEPSDPNFVRAASILEGAEMFDAGFFGFTPREAEVMDPQHRVFLECSWEAMEHAGYDPGRYKRSVGVFAGARTNTYLFNLFTSRHSTGLTSAFEIGLGNDLAFLPTRVSYKLNLRGPSYAVHTACSTSLVAVHLACQSLLIDECQMALAGGIAINVPQRAGYVFTRGGINSPDGHCRAFDARAQGTLFGSGVGVVVLKRLEDALADRDTVHAVIKGTAANNDGASKASFTAPSVQGQTDVIADALANAGVAPETLTYIETHGTGTALGDPIEITGLKRAFAMNGRLETVPLCAIGSVKTNLGHLDAAAGIASFIKTTLALKHRLIPPSLHFTEPNPNIDFENSPFYVNDRLKEWKNNGSPRRAAVSAFGVGGTNCNAVLEEAPAAEASKAGRSWNLLTLSARSEAALDEATDNLAAGLRKTESLNLSDVAFTLQMGRKEFDYRRAVVARDLDDAVLALEDASGQRCSTGYIEAGDRPVVFMFPGGGAQYPQMAAGLYESEAVFRDCVDMGRERLEYNLKEVLFPGESFLEEASRRLKQPSVGLPALFIVEYALARLWSSWGITPNAMIGHSLGEYVAATLAGVFSLEEALSLVLTRGRLFEKLPRGAMLSAALDEGDAGELLQGKLSIAALNAPAQSVLSGRVEDIEQAERILTGRGVEVRRIHIDVAAHSSMVDEILAEFGEAVAALDLKPPALPFISNVTGRWIAAEEATSPDYWTRHLRGTVRFGEGLRELMKEPSRIFLEVGPGQSLSTLAKLQGTQHGSNPALSSIRHPLEKSSDLAFILTTLGRLWVAGVDVGWEGFCSGTKSRRIPLPPYPFERQRYWIEGNAEARGAVTRATGKNVDVADWFHVPSWKNLPPLVASREDVAGKEPKWLVFDNRSSLSRGIIRAVRDLGYRVVSVEAGPGYQVLEEDRYAINPDDLEDFDRLMSSLGAKDCMPDRALHTWSLSQPSDKESDSDTFDRTQRTGFYSILYFGQSQASHNHDSQLRLLVATDRLFEIESADASVPEKATMLGPLKVLPQEFQNLTSQCVDISAPLPGSDEEQWLIESLLAEMDSKECEPVVAYRGDRRWVQRFEPLRLSRDARPARRLRENGAYLITGGLGGVGLLLAEHLAATTKARLVLVGRSEFPARAGWADYLASHDEDDPMAAKIARLIAIEQTGTELLVASADVADFDRMQSVVDLACARFGRLDGVIHAAGVTSGASVFQPVMSIGRDEAETQFRPKVLGVRVLERVLNAKDVDFCVMTSSNSSVLGGMGLLAYSAANAFMDAFALSRGSRNGSDRKKTAWISSSWDPWPEETKKYSGIQTSMDRYAMTRDESIDAFGRIISAFRRGHVVVATGDLPARISLWIERRQGDEAQAAAHPRPNMRGAYVAPADETGQRIASIWEQLLGVERIGAYDNFFDLGGHSLLATRLVARLREAFQIDLPLQKFFESPTVAGLAGAVSNVRADRDKSEKAALVQVVTDLSDEEVERQIARLKNQ